MSEPITAAQARALRNADTLVFNHRKGEGFIRAIQREENSSTGFEEVVRIDARTSCVTDYGERLPEHYAYDGSSVQMFPKSDPATRTLIRHLRTGKEFTLQWVRNNNNDNHREVGHARDELYVRIGDDKRADTFLVDVHVGPAGSVMRMVRAVWDE